jgi:outer membrane protein TolC
MTTSRISFAAGVGLLIALVGLGCATGPESYDYDQIVRARRERNPQASRPGLPAHASAGAKEAAAHDPPGPVSPVARSEQSSLAEGAESEPPAVSRLRVLTLAECISLALAANPDIGAAVARIRQSEAILDEARAPFLPALAFNTEILGGDSPSLYLFKAIDSRTLDPGTNFNYPGTFGSIETGLNLRYNLYNGGRDRLRRWMAQTGRDLRQLGLQEVRNSLVASVIHAFYDIQAQGEIISTAELSVRTVRAQYEETRAKMELGSALRSDVLSLKVRLAEAQERVIRASNARQLSTAALANLLGEDADAQIELHPEAEEVWLPDALPEQ